MPLWDGLQAGCRQAAQVWGQIPYPDRFAVKQGCETRVFRTQQPLFHTFNGHFDRFAASVKIAAEQDFFPDSNQDDLAAVRIDLESAPVDAEVQRAFQQQHERHIRFGKAAAAKIAPCRYRTAVDGNAVGQSIETVAAFHIISAPVVRQADEPAAVQMFCFFHSFLIKVII
ncbi:hypothetical protein NEILACOT_05305 [Neisseria lactamica ATCC 23970]|uniref:Uncharacterized protein n=1 Tax=Neisseria lactamica ATCC 23970 TaxID=546265 RepID=D0WCM3_NEILA|nr:hypothetical protein NEILACOT_05305 [Neisseria lactamica ATCC 23970]